VPGEGSHGCACVGFNNGWAQGGLNTEGLAFDWVAGYKEQWEPDPKLERVKGNPAQRMLERCASVQEAIAFFQTHWEPSFSYAKILVADRTGESVVIGARNGQLSVERKRESRALGYRGDLAETMLTRNPEPTISNAATILRAAVQEGQYATKYSNVFDLKTGDIYLYRFPEQSEGIKLNLTEELKKGRHFYDIPHHQAHDSYCCGSAGRKGLHHLGYDNCPRGSRTGWRDAKRISESHTGPTPAPRKRSATGCADGIPEFRDSPAASAPGDARLVSPGL
jgi:hypothetical protein